MCSGPMTASSHARQLHSATYITGSIAAGLMDRSGFNEAIMAG